MIDDDRRERLHALLDGELTGAAKRALETELEVDASLADELASFASLDRALRAHFSSSGAHDNAIAAAVLARAEAGGLLAVAPTRRAGRGWLAPLALAAALLLAVRALPHREAPAESRWQVASREGSALWVDESEPRKDTVGPGQFLAGDGELFALEGGGAALIGPGGTEILLAPRSVIAIDDGRISLLAGTLWVRGARPGPIQAAGARIEGRGSTVIDEEDGVFVVASLAGEALVRRGGETLARIEAGSQSVLGGKGGEDPRPSRGAALRLGWAIPLLDELGPKDAARQVEIARLVEGHIAALADDELGGMALKGIARWLGARAVPPLVDGLLAPAKSPGSPDRQRLVWALGEVVAQSKLDDGAVERLFELPLTIEHDLLGGAIDVLAAATGVEPVPDRGFWFGKGAPPDREESEKALWAWREQWRSSMPR